MARLHGALDEAASLALGALGRVELEEYVAQILKADQRIGALSATAVSAADDAGIARRQTLNSHLAALVNTASSQIAPTRTVGLWLRWFPELSEAWTAGVISEAHVRELRKLDNARTRRALVRDQASFVESAQVLSFTDWLSTLSYWLLHADPDGVLDPERDRSYGVSLRPLKNGDVLLSGVFDPIAGEALLTMLDHETEKLLRLESEDTAPGARRTPIRKLRLSALMRLLSRGFQRQDGTYPVPLVNLVMSQGVAQAILDDIERSDGIDTATELLEPHNIDGRCETIRGTPIHPRRAWPALLLGRLRRQVFNAEGRTIDVGHDVRLFNPAQKQALLVEARGRCQIAGCDAPFAWLVADHIVAHANNGPTDLANGQILCNPDNHHKGDR